MMPIAAFALLLASQEPTEAAAAFRARLDAFIEGRGYRTDQLNSRWANSAFTTRDPNVRALFFRVFADQWAQRPGPEFDVMGEDRYKAELDALFRRDSEWLKEVLARIGWFDISRYGTEASQAAWLIVQHADFDPEWQQQVLRDLKPRVARGDMQRTYYAYLLDRVAVNAGRPQTYGTQGRCVGSGDWEPWQVIEPDWLDRRRAEMGLGPISEYRARFTCR